MPISSVYGSRAGIFFVGFRWRRSTRANGVARRASVVVIRSVLAGLLALDCLQRRSLSPARAEGAIFVAIINNALVHKYSFRSVERVRVRVPVPCLAFCLNAASGARSDVPDRQPWRTSSSDGTIKDY